VGSGFGFCTKSFFFNIKSFVCASVSFSVAETPAFIDRVFFACGVIGFRLFRGSDMQGLQPLSAVPSHSGRSGRGVRKCVSRLPTISLLTSPVATKE